MTATRAVRIGGVTIGGGAPLALIGGPCAIPTCAEGKHCGHDRHRS